MVHSVTSASHIAFELGKFLLTGLAIGLYAVYKMDFWVQMTNESWREPMQRSAVMMFVVESFALFGFFATEGPEIYALSKAHTWWGSLLLSWALCTAVWLTLMTIEHRRNNRLIISLVQADLAQPKALPLRQAGWASLGLAGAVIWSLLAIAETTER